MEHNLNSAEIAVALEIAIRTLSGGNEAMDAAITQVIIDRDKTTA